MELIIFHDPCGKPSANERQYFTIGYSFTNLFHQHVMRDFIEKGHDVEINHIIVSAALCASNRIDCLVCGVTRAKAKAVIVKVLLKDRFDDLTYSLLAYAISDCGNT